MKQNQNIETSKHIEKLAKIIKLNQASKDLIRALQTSRLAVVRFHKEIKTLIYVLDLAKFEDINGNKYYYMKEDAIEDGFTNSLTWDSELKMWKVD